MQAILRENDKNYRAQPVVYTERATLHMERIHCRPHMPDLLKGLFDVIEQGQTSLSADAATMKSLFPKTFGQPKVVFQPRQGSMALNPLTGRKLIIGAVFSGGPAAGGHNVLTGLLDFMKRRNAESELIGFLGGPQGIVSNNHRVIHANDIESFRNLGGFHFLGSGRTKIETEEQLQSSVNTCRELGLDGLVIIGGDDSNTNAGILAEYFQTKNCHTCVIGVPKTIDGDLRNEDIEASFGFDTATKVYANSVANLCFDAISALKSYHFIRVMGRDASHITLEVALQTHPNLLFISEEVQTKNQTLTGVVDEIVALVVDRANIGKDYGTILIPEGLVGFASDMKLLIEELNDILANEKEAKDPSNFNANLLTPPAKTLYESLPEFILVQMMAERDPHGNVQVAAIETERLLGRMVSMKLAQLKASKQYVGKFSFVPHYLGYEGRCAFPSKFDCDYCYTLGATAGALVEFKRTGYVCSVKNLAEDCTQWTVGGSPMVSMMNIEKRKGKNKPVIKKKLVDLPDAPFQALQKMRASWRLTDDYRMPGPIQHSGGAEEGRNFTLLLEADERAANMKKLEKIGSN